MTRRRFLSLSFAFATALTPALTAAQFEPLLAKLPAGGNTLVMINADAVFQSELAQSEGWRREYGDNFSEAPLLMPPDAERFVLSSQLNPATMRPVWEVAAAKLTDDLSMKSVGRRVGGTPERLGTVQAVATRDNAYAVKFGPAVFGMMIPGDRQRTSRWAREAVVREQPVLSPYLTKVAAYPDRVGTEMILAIDLTDAISRTAIQQAMEASPAIAASDVDPAAATDALASLEGMTLGVVVKAKATGSLRVDFSKPITAIEPVAKKLLLEALEQAGLAIDELYDWKLQTSEQGFRLSGPLGQSGLRRLFSFIELDASGVAGGDVAAAAKPEPGQVSSSATKEHYDGVRKYLRDLKLETGAKSYASIASWFDRYAGRIDRLPLLNVDPQMLDYSATVVKQLRDCSMAIRGVGIRTSGRSAGVQGQSSGYGGYNDPYYAGPTVFSGSTYEQGKDAVRDAAAQRQAIGRQERATGSASVQEIVAQIKQETSAIRREMTQKHGIEF